MNRRPIAMLMLLSIPFGVAMYCFFGNPAWMQNNPHDDPADWRIVGYMMGAALLMISVPMMLISLHEIWSNILYAWKFNKWFKRHMRERFGDDDDA